MKILSLNLVKFLKLKFDQDLCQKLWYELNPRVRCAFGNVLYIADYYNQVGVNYYHLINLIMIIITTIMIIPALIRVSVAAPAKGKEWSG